MPHVDEGTLHALLDGALLAEEPDRAAEVEAHLRGCPDCRALLEEAAGIRAEAADVLAAAAPAAPPTADFADVRERAARGTGTAGGGRRRHGPGRVKAARQLRWMGGLAWAASLVLALGTGYLLRDLAAPASTAETATTRGAGAETTDAAAPPSSEAESTVQALPPPPPEAGDREVEDRTRQAGEAANGQGVPGASREAVAAGDRTSGDRPDAAEEIQVTGAGGRQAADLQAAPHGAPTPDPAKARTEPGLQPESQPPVTSRRAGGDAATGEAWISATLAEARAALGGPIYRLPRAHIADIYVGIDPAAPRVLTLQRLESGVPLRVIQSPGAPEAQPGSPDAPGAGGAADAAGGLPAPEVARVTLGRYVLEVTGSLPVELLSILAESATPAQ